MSSFGEVASRLARRFGLHVARLSSIENRLPIGATPDDSRLISSVRPFTMTSSERLWSLMNAVRYVEDHNVPGDFVECGVWRGGSVMAMAKTLLALDKNDRQIWLYDTFSGMTSPTDVDVEAGSGQSAIDLLMTTEKNEGRNVWCVAQRLDVETNLQSTGYPMERFTLIEGDVAETLSQRAPDRISLLRLDTDWYESTRVSLEVLFPRLELGGVCILDDYGHWQGARRAVDDYFVAHPPRPFMHPIDYSGRVFVKLSQHLSNEHIA